VIDSPKITELLARLQTYRGELGRLSRLSKQALLADPDRVGSAKYHFVVAIECCIDIANHIVASEGYRIPADSGDAFTVLVEERLLPAEMEAPLRAMARFRNRLVHLYWDVNDELVFEYLQTSLEDFDRFAAAVAQVAD